MDYYGIACGVLRQISDILTEESGMPIFLSATGNCCWVGNDFSIEIADIDLPQNLIGEPNPQCPQDNDGVYKVNRVHVGRTILEDTAKGFPFSRSDMKEIIKWTKSWAYYPKANR